MKTDLLQIPNVGKSIKRDFLDIGITCVEDLKGKSPEHLYQLDYQKKKVWSDRCLLYVFRMAVYYAENSSHNPEKLKWWYWKDKKYPEEE